MVSVSPPILWVYGFPGRNKDLCGEGGALELPVRGKVPYGQF